MITFAIIYGIVFLVILTICVYMVETYDMDGNKWKNKKK
jgi:hypothetical protein